MNLPDNLLRVQKRIRDLAASLGLDFFETIFEILEPSELNEVAAYGGFPTRYPHWRHGMEYEHLAKGHLYGLSKIYELVINNDPGYAYLLAGNSLVDQKLVIAHVYGHCDFFKNNAWFQNTSRRMIDQMANHAVRVRTLIDRHGQESVEDFLDCCLSIENLIDFHGTFVPAKEPKRPTLFGADEEPAPSELKKLKSKAYMDAFINPPDFLEEKRKKITEEEQRKKRTPPEPVRDVLGFLLEHAPLEKWEWELLHQIRDEALYFAPQRATKIMNEGWATFWHRRIMAEHVLTDEEVVDYALTMSGTLAGGSALNPYKIGLEVWLDIEERWNKGRYGLDWERCEDHEKKQRWDSGENKGREMIFRVRRAYNDVTFVDDFLTEELCHRNQLFVYRWNPQTRRKEIATRDFKAVKSQFLRQLSNGGAPVLEVVDANFENRGELLLVHRWDGLDLRVDYAQATLRNLKRIWKRPVRLHTQKDGKGRIYVADADQDRVFDVSESASPMTA
jgi:stage V sporulation protein R